MSSAEGGDHGFLQGLLPILEGPCTGLTGVEGVEEERSQAVLRASSFPETTWFS